MSLDPSINRYCIVFSISREQVFWSWGGGSYWDKRWRSTRISKGWWRTRTFKGGRGSCNRSWEGARETLSETDRGRVAGWLHAINPISRNLYQEGLKHENSPVICFFMFKYFWLYYCLYFYFLSQDRLNTSTFRHFYIRQLLKWASNWDTSLLQEH